jgi:GTPase
MAKSVVAIVGRPNVGKSTLFNRLAGERLAVVDEIPGTTRDHLLAESEWSGFNFDIIDTGGIDPTDLQSESPLSIGSADYIGQIRKHAELAAQDADAVIFLVDVEDGLAPADQEIAKILRRQRSKGSQRKTPPILLVVNKCDNLRRRDSAVEFYELGVGEPIPISAMHGNGVGDMLDILIEALQKGKSTFPAENDDETSLRIAIAGRPNVGKSSLLNRMLGEERVIVSPIPGTTRDAVDTELTYHGDAITLIDTAGIRRRGRIEPGVEKYSVIRSLKAIERAEVVLLLIDAVEGITAQDAHIAGMIIDKLKSVVVIVNKWDAVKKDTYSMPEFTLQLREALNFLDYVPILFISAKTGQRVGQVLPLAIKVQKERLRRIPTGELNRIVRRALDFHAPPSKSGKRLKIMYASQVRTDPPTILFHINDAKLAHFSYVRYLENRIRDVYGFTGTPLRISFRERDKKR